MKQKYQKWDEKSIEQLKCMYEDRCTMKKIADFMGRKLTSIKSALRKFGISKPAKYSKQIVNDLSDVDLAYIAGIVDGEGCIIIEKRTTTLLNGEKNPLYKACVKVGNNDEKLIDWLIKKVGGGYKSVDIREGKNNNYKWQLSQTMTLKLLILLKPYLVIKKEQVDVICDFRKSYENVYSRNGTPREIVDFRESCYKKLQNMHGGRKK
jgi:hypothetical protein